METFGKYVLANRRNAIIFAVLFSVIPLCQWISSIIFLLVTLRKGPREGLLVAIPASLVFVMLAVEGAWGAFCIGIAGSIYLWLMAYILWRYSSWRVVLEASIFLAVVIILAVHSLMPELNQWWITFFQNALLTLKNAIEQGGLVLNNVQMQNWDAFLKLTQETDILQKIANVALGSILIVNIIFKLVLIVLARGWQALLFNPKGLRNELQGIQLSGVVSIFFVGCLLAAYLGLTVFLDIIPVFIGIMMLAGLSLIHFFANKKQKAWQAWLIVIVVYGLLTVVPQTMLLALVAIAIADSVFNCRRMNFIRN